MLPLIILMTLGCLGCVDTMILIKALKWVLVNYRKMVCFEKFILFEKLGRYNIGLFYADKLHLDGEKYLWEK